MIDSLLESWYTFPSSSIVFKMESVTECLKKKIKCFGPVPVLCKTFTVWGGFCDSNFRDEI